MNKISKVNYGVDAPIAVRNFFIAGVILFLCGIFFSIYSISGISLLVRSIVFITAIASIVTACGMMLYSKKGKLKHSRRMLDLLAWTGNEMVLDVGTGLGLLMNGAAKRLTNGRAIGIDIWNKEDLSNNVKDKTKLNAVIEGVESKIEIKSENIMSTNFQDAYFDVVLSNLCLHNIYSKKGRKTACKEIHRILKYKGIAIISDYRHCAEYKMEFVKLGMTTEKIGPYYLDTFPPLTIIRAIKK